MPSSQVTALKNIASILHHAKSALDQIDWTDEQVRDAAIGADLTALETHLDNTRGRLSTLIGRVHLKDAQFADFCHVVASSAK